MGFASYAGGLLLVPGADVAVVFAVIFSAFTVVLGTAELMGLHLSYSKFREAGLAQALPSLFGTMIPSRVGMFALYFGPLVAYIVTFFAADSPTSRYHVALLAAWSVHFGKRCLEVLFVHIYSKGIPLGSSLLIMVSYSVFGAGLCLTAAEVTPAQAAEGWDELMPVGAVIFATGQLINGYHHWLLRMVRLRRSSEGGYTLPREIGGLFGFFTCPHYVGEMMSFLGTAVIGRTVSHWLAAVAVMVYLGARTVSTRRWYAKLDEEGGTGTKKTR